MAKVKYTKIYCNMNETLKANYMGAGEKLPKYLLSRTQENCLFFLFLDIFSLFNTAYILAQNVYSLEKSLLLVGLYISCVSLQLLIQYPSTHLFLLLSLHCTISSLLAFFSLRMLLHWRQKLLFLSGSLWIFAQCMAHNRCSINIEWID